jgi:hypothetical protein
MEWITYKSLILLTEIINCKERYSVYPKILVTLAFYTNFDNSSY